MIRHKNILIISISICLTGLYLLCAFRYSPFTYTTGDFAEYLNAAYRVVNGEKPYRDFWLMFPPLEVYFPAFILQSTGTANLFLYQDALIHLLNAVVVFLILRELKIQIVVSLFFASVLLFIGGTYFYISISLFSTLFIIRFMNTNRRFYLFIAAWIVLIGFGFRFYQMLPLVIAQFIWLYIHTRKHGHSSLLLYYSTFVIIAPLLIYYAPLPQSFVAFQSVMIDAVKHGTSFSIPYWNELRNNLYELNLYFDRYIANQQGYSLPGFFFLCLNASRTIIIYLLPLLALSLYVFRYAFRSEAGLFFVLWGLLFLPYALRFSNLDHLETAFTPFLILVLIGLGQWLSHQTSNRVVLFAVWSVFMLLQTYHEHRSHSGTAYDISSRFLSFKTMQGGYAKTVNCIIEHMHEHHHKTWVCAWNLPPLYLMTQRKNPCYYDSPIDLILHPDITKEDRVIACLNDNKVDLIILEIKNITHLSPQHRIETSTPKLYTYIQTHYKLSETIDRYAVFIKE